MILVLEKKYYDLLKGIDLFELSGKVVFDDKQQKVEIPDVVEYPFETGKEEIDGLDALSIVINDNIVIYGMKNQDICTDYGRQLYALYDLIFLSDNEKID